MNEIIPKPVNDIASTARAVLRGENPSPFSHAAFEVLQQRIEQHIDELVLESVRIMSRHQADTVSPAYVAQASENLVAGRRRRFFTFIGTLGGVLLGAAASSFLDMAKAHSVTAQLALTAALLGIVGSIMIAFQFARE